MTNNVSVDVDRHRTSAEAIEDIATYFREGRQIVPFLGAGASAGSGFPLTDGLREYLAKVKFFIRYGVYRRLLGEGTPLFEELRPDSLEYRPAKYLIEFGWPDFNRLNADLWQYAEKPWSDSHDPGLAWWHQLRVESENKTRSFAGAVYVRETGYLDRCLTAFQAVLCNKDNSMVDKDRLASFRSIAGFENLKQKLDDGQAVWGWDRSRIASLVQFILLEALEYEDELRTRKIEPSVWKRELLIRFDWFKLLHDLVEGRRGLADELLAQLNRNRSPSLAHLMLTHLTRRLGWRVLLTLNHDSLLEQAMISEGLIPKIFDVNAVSGVPDAALLRREPLSIVKLHGSSFGLRLGESTNDELDDTTRQRLLEYIPTNAVLLVLGFSGFERRMMSVIESIASRGSNHRILWMYYGQRLDRPEDPVRKLREQLRLQHDVKLIEIYRLNDSGTFLKGLYQRITNTLPATRTVYTALPKRVMAEQSEAAHQGDVLRLPADPKPEVVQLFIRDRLLEQAPGESQPYESLVEPGVEARAYLATTMSAFIRQKSGYDVIWIDVEEHHTVTGIVSDVISRMRVFDPNLPPLVLPVTDSGAQGPPSSKRFERAARYIRRALRRGRYILAFDSVESFGRPQTTHHGLTSVPRDPLITAIASQNINNYEMIEQELSNRYYGRHQATEGSIADFPAAALRDYRRLLDLFDFIKTLICIDPKHDTSGPLLDTEPGTESLSIDWYLCLSVDVPQPRHTMSAHDQDNTYVLNNSDLTLFAIKRFYKSLTATLGMRLYSASGELQIAPNEYEGNVAGAAKPGFPRPIRVAVTQVKAVPGKVPPESGYGDLLNRLIKCLRDLNNGMLPDETRLQDLVDQIIEYSLARFAKVQRDSVNDLSEPRNDAALLFILLSVFRRPRTLASIKGVIERLQAILAYRTDAERIPEPNSSEDRAFNVRDALLCLCNEKLVHLTEGELYFISQHVHEVTYKIISEPLRLSRWMHWSHEEWKVQAEHDLCWLHGASPVNAPRTLMRALWLARVHSCIGRHYYLHIWQRSHDNSALYEYLYHRVGSLRYLMLLRVRLDILGQYLAGEERHPCDPSAAAWNQDVLELFLQGREENGYRLQSNGPNVAQTADYGVSQDAIKKWRLSVDSARSEYLNSLINVLERERVTILASAPGDTWLNWIRRLLEVDLAEMKVDALHKAITASSDTLRPGLIGEYEHSGATSWFSNAVLFRRLERLLGDMEGQLYREMGAHLACVRARLIILIKLIVPLVESSVHPSQVGAVESKVDMDPCPSVGLLAQVWAVAQEHQLIAEAFKTVVGRHIEEFGTVDKLGDLISGAVIDLAASIRHFESDEVANELLEQASRMQEELMKQLGTDLPPEGKAPIAGLPRKLREIRAMMRAWLKGRQEPFPPSVNEWLSKLVEAIQQSATSKASVKELRPQRARFHRTQKQPAIAALTVSSIRCRFEQRRLQADRLAKRRYGILNYVGLPAESPIDIEKRRDEVRGELAKLHRLERRVYGAPFRDEREFVLHVSRFATLRATLLPLLLSEPAYEESLRLLEEAESGLTEDAAAHTFHKVIIHTQRAHALMLMADAALRRNDSKDERCLLPLIEYKRTKVLHGLSMSDQRLAAAGGELVLAERILGSGRRSVRTWRRLYMARAQLAIEELLNLCVRIEFATKTISGEHSLVAKVQSCLLGGLEAVRGALDCTLYPPDVIEGGRRVKEELAVGRKPELAELEEVVGLYMRMFAASQQVLYGYTAVVPRDQIQREDEANDFNEFAERLSKPESIVDRWEALNHSAGLARVFNFLVPPGGGDGAWLKWNDVIELCRTRDRRGPNGMAPPSPETFREKALAAVQRFQRPPPSNLYRGHRGSNDEPNGTVIEVILLQRSERDKQSSQTSVGVP